MGAAEKGGGSVALQWENGRTVLRIVPLSAVAAKTRHMPREFIDGHRNVSRAFIDYCLPLVGGLPVMERLP